MDERKDDLEASLREGNDIYTTINTKGWKNVIEPALRGQMKSLVKQFTEASGYEELVRIQQAVNAINNLLDFIEVKLIEGKVALKELRDSVVTNPKKRDDKSQKE